MADFNRDLIKKNNSDKGNQKPLDLKTTNVDDDSDQEPVALNVYNTNGCDNNNDGERRVMNLKSNNTNNADHKVIDLKSNKNECKKKPIGLNINNNNEGEEKPIDLNTDNNSDGNYNPINLSAKIGNNYDQKPFNLPKSNCGEQTPNKFQLNAGRSNEASESSIVNKIRDMSMSTRPSLSKKSTMCPTYHKYLLNSKRQDCLLSNDKIRATTEKIKDPSDKTIKATNKVKDASNKINNDGKIKNATDKPKGAIKKISTKSLQNSACGKKKSEKKINTDEIHGALYNEHGFHISSGMNLCDCLHVACPGCHIPCKSCLSSKCGTECRNNRTYMGNPKINAKPKLQDASNKSIRDKTEDATDKTEGSSKKMIVKGDDLFMHNSGPNNSVCEKKIKSKRSGKVRGALYDEYGFHIRTGINLCDCLQVGCPGCHFPCNKCSSPKCGIDCRNNRKYIIEELEYDGYGCCEKVQNPLLKK